MDELLRKAISFVVISKRSISSFALMAQNRSVMRLGLRKRICSTRGSAKALELTELLRTLRRWLMPRS